MRERWILNWMMAVLLAWSGRAAAAPGEGWTQPARYRFEYDVDLAALTRAHGEGVRVWLPYPAETADQRVLSVQIDSPWAYQINTDTLGNRIVYLDGQGVTPRPLTMRFDVERAPSHGIRLTEARAGTVLDPTRYLKAERLVPLDGLIAQVATQESRGRTTDAEKIRAFYDYVVRTMRYNKDGTGWGRGDAIWACSNKRGNCTDFHSLFIGLARSVGIPARFIIGFPIPAESDAATVPGYHCWAQYYDHERGWVPVDTSEANKTGLHDAYFGKLPNNRIEFVAGRDLVLTPPQQGPPLNFFIYPYAEAKGVAVGDIQASFRFQRLPRVHAQR